MTDRHRLTAIRLALVYTGSNEHPDVLWKLTRYGSGSRPEWIAFRGVITLNVDEIHERSLPSQLKQLTQHHETPFIIARYESGSHHVVLPAGAIAECKDLRTLIEVLRAYGVKYNIDLGFTPR